MTAGEPQRRWRGTFELRELLESMPGGIDFAVRDFALLTIAGTLTSAFPGRLVFKGGFVLRHVHGHLRFSKDIDATSFDKARLLTAPDVSEAIRQASIQNVVHFAPGVPANDSSASLDFDNILVSGEMIPDSQVQVEVSFREAVVGEPVTAFIGGPYYHPFGVLVMQPAEMVAEKLRALAQRIRATDLADLAVLLSTEQLEDHAIARYAVEKFRLVKHGRLNRSARVERNIAELADSYDDVVRNLFPDAPTYAEATAVVLPRVRSLIP